MNSDPTKKLKIAVIYSYAANEEEVDGMLDEENSEDTSALDQPSRDFLESAIQDYNKMFNTNYAENETHLSFWDEFKKSACHFWARDHHLTI